MKKINPWLCWLLVIMVARWVTAEVKLYQINHRISGLWTATSCLKAVDDATGTPLPPQTRMPNPDKDGLPIVNATDSDRYHHRSTVLSDRAVPFGVSAEGYRGKWVNFDEHSPKEIEVRLEKADHPK